MWLPSIWEDDRLTAKKTPNKVTLIVKRHSWDPLKEGIETSAWVQKLKRKDI